MISVKLAGKVREPHAFQKQVLVIIIYGDPSDKSPECLKTYKDTLISSLTLSLSLSHTHTHTCRVQIHALLMMGWYNEKKTTDQYAGEMRWGFQF